jgi:murein DD-endopeptidase MepM/ murein hydrolase activator NlpD
MKLTTIFTTAILVFAAVVSTQSLAQVTELQIDNGGGYPAASNSAAYPCITPREYDQIDKRIAENIKLLQPDKNARKTTGTTKFIWPLQMANGLNDCSYYYISKYVDQDPTAGIKDYNCGSATYDAHRGTDISTAPYPFYKMDNNQVQVIAAAPGTIIDKSDGYFDKNCVVTTDTANYIIIQHTDGSCALYWHMKKFSLTSKIIGQTVLAGEVLGVVGSSGDATGPHLHFEVWATTLSSSLNDPYTGACNTLNPATWWVTQKPYTEPAIIKAQVNSIPIVLPGCDTTETPNEDTCYAPGATAKFYIFIRNETTGDTAKMRIINPDGTTFSSWVHNSIADYPAAYWYWNKTLSATPGRYTFESVYNGITCASYFQVRCGALGTPTDRDPSKIVVTPNPASNMLNISSEDFENGSCKFILRNIIGQVVLGENILVTNNSVQKNISISGLPNGIYFLTIESDKNRTVQKIIKQN